MDVQELGDESKNTVEHGQENNPANDSVRKKAIDRYKDPERQKKYRAEWGRKNYHKVAESRRKYSTEYYHANRERVLKQKEARRNSDTGEFKVRIKEYAQANRAKISEQQRIRRKENAELERQKRVDYLPRRRELSKLRRAENPTRKMIENCRSRIRHILKREKVTKTQNTFKFIGCTAEFFRTFLEWQFTSEMNWSNYGTCWTVDHIIPISYFNLHNPDHSRIAFNYSNCRPLHADKNSEKNDTLPGPHQPWLL